ncbi:unnamed protein product [Mycena citricolor]|uniref:F-box domain-containing protein n=1 Tax=Mycena citricolor TaxID=2018698 RepID=A0AAD2HXV6_9AGAR|nr:unnamed protein product [Mycena citricolor]
MTVQANASKQRVDASIQPSSSDMSWSDHLRKAKAYLKVSKLDEALNELDHAVGAGGADQSAVYNTRSSVFQRQKKHKRALQDVKKAISLVPDDWHGYARAASLLQEVCKPKEAIAMANMAISRLDPTDTLRLRKLNELKDQAGEAQRRMVCHFDKLPVEMITVIFDMVLETKWGRVLDLWRVCKHWHGIALETPRYWTTLALSKHRPAQHAQKWLERSKGRIRRLSLDPTFSLTTVELNGLSWAHLRTLTLDESLLGIELAIAQAHAISQLEELHVVRIARSCDALVALPLRKLVLYEALFSWETLCARTGLSSLEIRLPRSVLTTQRLIELLDANQNELEQLVLELRMGDSATFPTEPVIALPRLRNLQLSGSNWSPNILRLGTMPSLEVLQLSGIRRLDLSPLITLTPPLLILSITSCILARGELQKLLEATPLLHTLRLTRLEAVNGILESLGRRSETVLCPALLNLDVSHCADVRTGPIITLLKLRNPPLASNDSDSVTSRIQTIAADGCPKIEAACIPWISAQVQAFTCIYLDKKAASWKR